MSLTSCDPYLDDILGEWSRPTPGGNVTPGGGSSSDEPTPTMEATPLTLEATTAGTINIANSQAITIKYSKDGGATKTESSATSIAIEVAAGDKVQLYGTTATGSGSSIGKCVKITGSGAGFECTVYGNIMSLLSETGFDENTTLTDISTFRALFKDNTTLTDASKLLLPATTLTNACYDNMFCGCTALTAAPELPATEGMSSTCYQSMFEGCSSLTEAPSELPATTLGSNCYRKMFKDCISLTAAPQLKATTLADWCCAQMFQDCSSLTTAPELKAETLKPSCYNQMFYGCSKLSSVICLATTLDSNGCNNWLNGAGTDASVTSRTLHIKAGGPSPTHSDWELSSSGDGGSNKWTAVADQ